MLGTLTIICGFIFLLYYYFTANFNFWEKRGVPGPKPKLFFGTMKDVMLGKIMFSKYVKKLYDSYGDTPFIGIFQMKKPFLIIKDPELIKDIFIRDSKFFLSRGIDLNLQAEPLSQSLFFVDWNIAYHLRTKFSQTFTPHKLKIAFETMLKSAERLQNHIDELLSKSNYVNCSDLAVRFSSNAISSILMDIDIGSYNKGKRIDCEFVKYANRTRGTYWEIIAREVMKLIPQLYGKVGHYLFGFNKITQFYTNFTNDIMKYRKDNAVKKSDWFNLLIELKENPGELTQIIGTNIPDHFYASQVFGFFFGGFETSSTTISNTLFELAQNQSVQDKLRKEITDTIAKNNRPIQFEDLTSMNYLNAVLKETLRLYPVGDSIMRQSNSEYTFKNTNVTIPKNQYVVIPVLALHYDSQFYSKPNIYNPERFVNNNLNRESGYFIPFGYGPRNCIGERLGFIQLQIGIISLMQNYKYELCNKTSMINDDDISLSYGKFSDKERLLKVTKLN